jgi:hypothetical protein
MHTEQGLRIGGFVLIGVMGYGGHTSANRLF